MRLVWWDIPEMVVLRMLRKEDDEWSRPLWTL